MKKKKFQVTGVAEGMTVKVKPSKISPDNKTYKLDIVADSFKVDWGDGVIDSSKAHTYADGSSEYTVQVTGANITKLSQDAPILSNGYGYGYALTALLRMNLPNLNNTDTMFKYARNIQDWSNLALPEGLTSIGSDAFVDCSSLALTSLPAGVTTIGIGAFAGCSSLALVSLPSGVTSIGAYAFGGCTNLALTSLPEGLTTIGEYAFSDCYSLALTSLPSGLTSIGDCAFYGCPKLADVVFLGTPNRIESDAFGYTSANLFVPWPNGAVANAPWGTQGIITYGYIAKGEVQ